jgi:hypothetical protein
MPSGRVAKEQGESVDRFRFDWRWIALIVFVALLANSRRLPTELIMVALLVAGGYLLKIGWDIWSRAGAPLSRSRVTYWRGQRIELEPPRRSRSLPSFSNIGPAAIYLLLGGILVLAGISLILRRLGL